MPKNFLLNPSRTFHWPNVLVMMNDVIIRINANV